MKKTKKGEVSVAERVIKILEKKGVKYVFGVPGEEVEDLLFAISNSKIKFIATRHEQGASFMANVWGRLTGEVGVCLSTLGPGATNLLTGLADASLDKSPVLAITGQADTGRLHKESHQYIDVEAIFKPITKWNTVLHNSKVVSEVVSKAIFLAEQEKPGVTHIDIPEDVALVKAEEQKISLMDVTKKHPNILDVLEVVSFIQKSKRPVIISGNGVVRKNASDVLRKIVEKYNIPVISTFMGKGALSDRSPLSLKTIGLKAKDVQGLVIDNSDLVITIGYDIAELHPLVWNSNKNIIHIDYTDTEIYEDYIPKVSVLGDIEESLNLLFKELQNKKIKKFSDWFKKAREAIVKEHESYSKNTKSITIPFVLNELRSVMKDDDILISDVGSHKMWVGRNFSVYEPNTCIISNGLASMGIALPGGLSAKLAKPKSRVVAVMGDGGFLMNSQEIETAKRIGTPFVIVVLNDNDYGLISWKQNTSKGKSFGTKLTNPDFVKYAESFGIKAYKTDRLEEVAKVLKTAIDSNELCFVTFDIDPSVNLELSAKLGKNLKIKI